MYLAPLTPLGLLLPDFIFSRLGLSAVRSRPYIAAKSTYDMILRKSSYPEKRNKEPFNLILVIDDSMATKYVEMTIIN